MGVELRSIQRKFHSLMGEVKPAIRPRFVVWLDERLAEFKIKGEMNLVETLDDPQWIKSYYTSKRKARAAAIMKREARETGSSPGSSVRPKVEATSESSNGIAHVDEVEERVGTQEGTTKKQESSSGASRDLPKSAEESDFQLVEVKQELLEEDDDDDDMIILGETTVPPTSQVYTSDYGTFHPAHNPIVRTASSFHRKRQRFTTFQQRPYHTLSTNRLKTRRTFRSASDHDRFYPSHTATSKSGENTQRIFDSNEAIFRGETSRVYDSTEGATYDESTYGATESLRIPSHLQPMSDHLQLTSTDYTVGGGEGTSGMYTDYGDESYDASYIVDPSQSTLQYDDEGNAVIKGEQQGDESSIELVPGISEGTQSQGVFDTNQIDRPDCQTESTAMRNHPIEFDATAIYRTTTSERDNASGQFICEYCSKTFTNNSHRMRHIRFSHLRDRTFACSTCHRRFQDRVYLDQHINQVHLNVRPYVCGCGEAFFGRYRYGKHWKQCPSVTYH